MLIELDTKLLKRYRLSVNQFVILFLVYSNELVVLESIASQDSINDVKELIRRNFITYKNFNEEQPVDFCRITLNQIATQLFDTSDCFDELLALFPTMVVRTDGTRDYLKLDINRTRKVYNKIVGKTRRKHDLIMQCLALEIQDKTRTGKMSYFKRLPKWIASEEWTAYEQFLLNQQDTELTTNKIGYGEQLE